MSGIFGLLGVSDTERVFLSTLGQDVIYDAIGELLTRYNAELNAAQNLFVQRETENFKERYKLAGGGRLQKSSGLAPTAEVKAYGGWDVAFPLEGYGAAVGAGRIDYAYMTVQDLNRHIDTVMVQDINTVRFEMLRRIFNDTQRTFQDKHHGSLLVEPLANGDAILYPPILGTEDEAIENHYYITGYTAASISDTNNPFATIRDELQEHFGAPTGGSNIICFIHPDQVAKTEALTDFVEVEDRFIQEGDDTAIPVSLPSSVPGRIIGRVSGCWVSEWRWIPTGYIYGQHLEVSAPLIRRVDPSDTGLARGLTLVAERDEYPIETSYWEHRFGFGVGNRLNGVFLEFDASTWDFPPAYAY